jgi:hypothetical protein
VSAGRRCTTGKHSSKKPAKPAASPNKPLFPPAAAAGSQSGVNTDCPRCRQGFFCADHRSIPGEEWTCPSSALSNLERAQFGTQIPVTRGDFKRLYPITAVLLFPTPDARAVVFDKSGNGRPLFSFYILNLKACSRTPGLLQIGGLRRGEGGGGSLGAVGEGG